MWKDLAGSWLGEGGPLWGRGARLRAHLGTAVLSLCFLSCGIVSTQLVKSQPRDLGWPQADSEPDAAGTDWDQGTRVALPQSPGCGPSALREVRLGPAGSRVASIASLLPIKSVFS